MKQKSKLEELVDEIAVDEVNAVGAGNVVGYTGPVGASTKKGKSILWSNPPTKGVKVNREAVSFDDLVPGGEKVNTRKPMFAREVERITNLALYGETDDEIIAAIGTDNKLITPRWIKFVAAQARKSLAESSLFKGPRDVEPASDEDDINAPKDYPAFGGDPNMVQGMMGTDSHYNFPPAQMNPELVHSQGGDVKRRGRTVSDKMRLNRKTMDGQVPDDLSTSVPERPMMAEQQTGGQFLYHATNDVNLGGIIETGVLIPHSPSYGTDQDEWPDGSVEDRSYFGTSPKHVEPFYPEHGKPILLRIPVTAAPFKKERGTGDWYTTKPIQADKIQFLDPDSKSWEPVLDTKQLKFPFDENVLDQQHQIKTPGTRGPYGTPTYIQKDDSSRKMEMGILKKVKKNLDKKAYTLHNPPSMGISITNPKLKDRPNKNKLEEQIGRLYGPKEQAPKVILKPSPDKRVAVKVEVRDTTEGRTQGLMHRKHLREGHGMIFVFPFPMQQKFWMKNTHIPLDMVFITPERRVLGVSENATPLSENQFYVPGESMYVLEVPAGFARRYGISKGTMVEFQGIPLIGKR